MGGDLRAPHQQRLLEGNWPLGVLQLPIFIAAVFTVVLVCRWCQITTPGTVQAAGSDLSLDVRQCEWASNLRTCSYQATAGAELGPGVHNGSLQAIKQLYTRGVTCFHLDVLATADGKLLATLVARLQQVLPDVRVVDGVVRKTLAQLRGEGASVSDFPTLDKVIEEFGARLGAKERAAALTNRPVLLLDLKAFSAEHLRFCLHSVHHRVRENVALIVANASQSDQLASVAGGWPGPLIKAFKANETHVKEPASVKAATLAPYAAVALSLGTPKSLFQAVEGLGKLAYVGLVEDEAALQLALELPGVAGIVSTSPLRLKRTLAAWRQKCMLRL